MGTTYGPGDGADTFNLPDKTGRVSAMQEAAASRLTLSFFGGNSMVLGAVGGFESATAPLPAHTHANTLTDLGHEHFSESACLKSAKLRPRTCSGAANQKGRPMREHMKAPQRRALERIRSPFSSDRDRTCSLEFT
jgi:microcystin-dependent protein